MNTLLKITALSLAAALPSSLALWLAGANLPTACDPLHVLGAFVVALAMLTLFGDYRTRPALIVNGQRRAACHSRAEHPLAA